MAKGVVWLVKVALGMVVTVWLVALEKVLLVMLVEGTVIVVVVLLERALGNW